MPLRHAMPHMAWHAMRGHAVPVMYHAQSCHEKPHYAMPCHTMPCHATPTFGKACHAMHWQAADTNCPSHAVPMPRPALPAIPCHAQQRLGHCCCSHAASLLQCCAGETTPMARQAASCWFGVHLCCMPAALHLCLPCLLPSTQAKVCLARPSRRCLYAALHACSRRPSSHTAC